MKQLLSATGGKPIALSQSGRMCVKTLVYVMLLSISWCMPVTAQSLYPIGNADANLSSGNGFAAYVSLAINNSGTLYMSYPDPITDKAIVKQYNGSAWVTVGSGSFSTGDCSYTSLAIDGSGTPYVSLC